MPEPMISLTKADLQELLASVMAQSKQMNPLEQQQYDEEVKRTKNRREFEVAMAKQEEELQRRKQTSCTHAKDSKTGNAVLANGINSSWTTGGQAHGNGTATLVCLRCGTPWHFKPSPSEYSFILENGLMGSAPPPKELLVEPY